VSITPRFSSTCLQFATLAAALAAPMACAGDLYLLGAVPYSYVYDISNDAKVASGGDQSHVWYWTKDTWVVLLGDAPPYGNGIGGVPVITADGTQMTCSTWDTQDPATRKAVGSIYNITQASYTPFGITASNCGSERYGAWGMNSDASYACGLLWDGCSAHGYALNRTTGASKILPETYFYKPTRADAISEDGSVAAGWNDDYNGFRQGCAWKRDASGNYSAKLMNTGVTTQKLAQPECISRNGWIFGGGRSSIDNGAPYRWSYASGYQSLGAMPEAGVGTVISCNNDGTMAYIQGANPYLWIQSRGYVPLATWCSEHNFTLTSEWSFVAYGMSPDGLALTGYAIRTVDGVWSPYVIDLHPSSSACTGDLNNDRVVNGADLGILLGDWGGNNSSDLNGDHVVNGADLGILLGAWGNCP
jgi:hypothetical protein